MAEHASEERTRDAVARILLEQGPQTIAVLADRLGLSTAAVRRHIGCLVADGLLVEVQNRRPVRRGRGRPARTYTVTDAGRAAFPHSYDDLATTALRYLRDTGGEQAVVAFADHRAATLALALTPRVSGSDIRSRVESLTSALIAEGYAATTEDAPVATTGVQICQHHCPVAHVAAEFPQLCEAETRAFEGVLGTYVQRLATIAHGDGVCTTHVPTARQPISDTSARD
jgi:predicted ArsR family transcriptional regulator